MDELQEKKQMVVHEIKKGDGRYINGEYVIEYNGAEYSFPNEAAAMGVFIDAMGDLHRNRMMVDVCYCSTIQAQYGDTKEENVKRTNKN